MRVTSVHHVSVAFDSKDANNKIKEVRNTNPEMTPNELGLNPKMFFFLLQEEIQS